MGAWWVTTTPMMAIIATISVSWNLSSLSVSKTLNGALNKTGLP